MLSKLQQLGTNVDGRYASDDELQFMDTYIGSFDSRVEAYQRIKAVEKEIVETVLAKLQSSYPKVLLPKGEDMQAKWKQDTFRVLRHSAMTVLLDDPELLRQQFLYWFQTIMQAFGAQEACDITYLVMQDVVKQLLPKNVSDLLCPILEMNRNLLGHQVNKNM
ncbi:phycobilisome protein [Pseudanabaena sp. FACHB-1998]|uniref:phycobilisome protein n=1 Tax=Pseudanabaena sp. FACHB-1998 TaxID=2692858 RepID=UPI001680A785|nr:phycobilisome protein [Pseudanabaena sp. FACHB-1998]MBD2178032.1 phycobilisome protein [Pseudanabaena sp. FACHB-1998]